MTEQEKRDKITKGLECCSGSVDNRDCDSCPIGFGEGCALKLKRDALALLKAQEQKCRECGEATSKAIQELQAKLKAQEPVVPVFSPEIEMDMSHWDCGACGGFLMGNAYPNAIKYIKPQYCSHCGRKVKWE